MRTNNKQEKEAGRMTRGIIPALGSLRLIGNRIRDTLRRGVIAGWMGILALAAAPLAALADTTTTQSWPGGLTNYQIYQSTDVLPTPQGWNAPASGKTQPSPPSIGDSAVAYYQGEMGEGYVYTSGQDAEAAICRISGWYKNCTYLSETLTTWTGQELNLYYNTVGTHTAGITHVCKPGYSYSQPSSCILSAPTQVSKPPDGTCTLIHNADGTYFYDTGGGLNGGDPDCTAAWQDAVAAVSDKIRGDACSCDSATPSTPSIPEPGNSN